MTTNKPTVTLYYSPQTRATGTRVLLEELGAPYELEVLNMKAGEQRQPAYLAINPLGTIPLLEDGEARMTESAAICQYLVSRYGPSPLNVAPEALSPTTPASSKSSGRIPAISGLQASIRPSSARRDSYA